MKEKIDDLRDWAATRARSASGLPIESNATLALDEDVSSAVPKGFRNLELGD